MKEIWLDRGSHEEDSGKCCLMEAVSREADEKWSAHPRCVPADLGDIGRQLNDLLDDADRQLLSPLVEPLSRVAKGHEAEILRRRMMEGWLFREYLAGFLRLAEFDAYARDLERLPRVFDQESSRRAAALVETMTGVLDNLAPARRIYPLPFVGHRVVGLAGILPEHMTGWGVRSNRLAYRCARMRFERKPHDHVDFTALYERLQLSLVDLFADMVNLKPCGSCGEPASGVLCEKCSWGIELEKRAEHREEDQEWT